MTSTPPYPSLATARAEHGAAGVRALVAWVAATHPPHVSTLRAAVLALGCGSAPAEVRAACDALRRAARRVGTPLPQYPPGTPPGHPSHATRPPRGAGKPRRKRTPKSG